MTASLQVEGTVDLRVDGVAATLTGRGPALVLRSDQPGALIDGLSVRRPEVLMRSGPR
ncbi:MAG: hypothetical protein ABJC62_14115 [Frankiaceae bacterium]